MKELLINQVIPQVLSIVITIITGLIAVWVKKYIKSKEDFLAYQKQQLIQQIGIDKYNADIDKAKEIVMAVEQMGKEFNWEGAIKHSKAVEKITAATGLSSGDIFDIIKATVGELNKGREKVITDSTVQVTTQTTSNTAQTGAPTA